MVGTYHRFFVFALFACTFVHADTILMETGSTVVVSTDKSVYGASGYETVVVQGQPSLKLDGNIERLVMPGKSTDYHLLVKGTQIVILLGTDALVTFSGLNKGVVVAFDDGEFDLELKGLGLATLGGQNIDEDEETAPEPCPIKTSEEPISPGPYDHHLAALTSTDGKSFTGVKTSLLDHASAPDAVLGTDGNIWVYYVNGTPGQHGIFIAKVNSNGAVEPFECVRINGAFDATAVDPDVVQRTDGRYQLFYNPLVSPSGNDHEGIYSAISTDGIHFTDRTQLIQHQGALNPSGVQLTNGTWVLTYTDESRTYVAVSDDGKHYQGVSDFTAGLPELSYLATNNELRLYNAERTGLTLRTSYDGGINWTDEETYMSSVQDPSVLKISDTDWRLYYRFESSPGP